MREEFQATEPTNGEPRKDGFSQSDRERKRPQIARSGGAGQSYTEIRLGASDETGQQRRSIEVWTEALTHDILAYRSLKRRRWQRPLYYALIGAVSLVVWSLFSGTWSAWKYPFYMMFMVFAGKQLADLSAESRHVTTLEVSKIQDPRVVNVLALAATETDLVTKNVARGGLKSILPNLKPADCKWLSEEGLDALLKLLRCTDAELTLAILHVMRQVGDPRFIAAVEGLITNPINYSDKRTIKQRLFQTHSTYNPQGDRVLDAAHETLRVLLPRLALDKQRRTLLRPADPVDANSNLLRPATGHPDTPEQQLLRPAE